MKMHKIALALTAALLIAPAAAQISDPGKPDRNATPAAMAGSTDGEALATVMAVNDHEMKAAALAKKMDVSAPVREYADMLDKEHTANQRQTEQLSKAADVRPRESAAVETMKKAKAAERDRLAAMKGDAFEAAWIDAMVKDHTEALAKIDNELLPNARNADVAEHLRTTRAHIAKHLEQAKQLDGDDSAMSSR